MLMEESWLQLVNRLMNKKTTIHDIAKELDITASTVSRALQNNPRISDTTKKLVLRTAKLMNYQPNSIAAALRNGKSNLIGVMIPTVDRNFFGSVVRGVEDVLNSTGYNVIICQSNDSLAREKSNIKTLLQARVDGIFVSYAKETEQFDHFKEIINQGVPLIFFDRMQNMFDVDTIVIDDYKGAFQATEHLIEQGCKKIIHFAGPNNLSIYKDRQRGYEDALRKHLLPVKEEHIFRSNIKLEAGIELGKLLTEQPELPDGIFSSSDYAAIGAIQVIKEKGHRVPEDIAVVGFSNESFTSLLDPSLSTVDQQSKKMGQFVANTFLNRMKKGEPYTPSRTVLSPELIIRTSSSRKSLIKKDSNYI